MRPVLLERGMVRFMAISADPVAVPCPGRLTPAAKNDDDIQDR
jgi:hypothetical protein